MDLNFNADSHHHRAQKQGVSNTGKHRTRVISEAGHLNEELDHFYTVLTKNGYSRANTKRAIRRKRERKEHTATTYIPYVKGCIDKIGHVLRNLQVKAVFVTTEMLGSIPKIRSTPNHLNASGVYSIPCSHGKVYRKNSNHPGEGT